MTKKSTDFVEALSFDTPAPFESSFTQTPSDRDVVPASNPANPYGAPYTKQHYDYYHDVFVIYRPYDVCKWCVKALRDGRLNEPEGDDFICPHTRRNAYHALMQKMIEEGYRKHSYKEETLKNGTIQVSISWTVPKEKEKRRRARLDL